VSAAVRGFADRLAAAGLAALVWDPYSAHAGEEQLTQYSSTLRDATVLNEQRQWLDYMSSRLGIAHLAAMGWCMGGRYGLLLQAAEPRIEACVAYYPSIRESLLPHQDGDVTAVASGISCPTMVIYPGLDHVTSWDTFLKLEDALRTRTAVTSIQLYPRANHNFLARDEAVNRATSDQSWPQSVAFLRAHLGLAEHRFYS
jgi:carboxymethylenebutenolidase